MIIKEFLNDSPDLNGRTLKRGDDYEVKLVVLAPDQTGATIQFVAKTDIADADASAFLKPTVTTTITSELLTATFSISSAATESLAGGETFIYGWQRRIGTKTTTLLEGEFSIEADVVQEND